ncbi:Tic20-like protein [Penicillium chermesinum]|uniref:DASH complex subunit DUO1 n=1 Tax=Penicillium chermesinum TaxID=63820 RepID=A0A9W9P8D2_9EURO|nr:Tic20-like protein [Penicillium chermesinum]KAJ5239778.1 Tic20-like protein [Penicillium chermesinum]KAJ6166657.1 Tic20-like protein [Penicillium chermesinum]
MARSAAEEMERLDLSDEDTEDLWNSPSKRGNQKAFKRQPGTQSPTTESHAPHNAGDTLFDRQEAREAALHAELHSVRNINNVIEGLLKSLDNAKGNMEKALTKTYMKTVSNTVTSASTLLNTWTKILSQTEHNQRLILNPKWQGATQDVADMEQEAIQKQQAAERRELALQQQREAAARKAEEDERRRLAGTRGSRGTSRGTVRSTGLGRTPSVSTSRTAATRGSSTATRRPVSGIARGGAARGRVPGARASSLAPVESRVRSPNPRSPRASADLPSPRHFAGHGNTRLRDVEGGHVSLGAFETSLPIRMDVEAALAYLLLPPAGGLFLLLTEHRSDYVRFHAWQSSMLFATMFVIHLMFAWTSFISWTLFAIDLFLICYLGLHAYRDVETLDHFEVPFFGRLANSFVDNE